MPPTLRALVGSIRDRILHGRTRWACGSLVVGLIVTVSEQNESRWKIHRFGWLLDSDPIFPASPSWQSQKNVRLLSRNRFITAMAGPDRAPGMRDAKKLLATAAVAR